MAKASQLSVTILNWDKYNPRKDVKNPSWFRLEHSLFEDPEFFDLTHSQLLIWIYLLTNASKKNGPTFILSITHAERVGRFKAADIYFALEILQSIHCVHVDDTGTSRPRDADVTSTNATNVRTYETNKECPDLKTDIRTEPNTIEPRTESNRIEPESPPRPSRQDFEQLYKQLYPRKEGKKRGVDICMRTIDTFERLKELEFAIRAYEAHCKKTNQFYKHFGTFMSCWEDYLEPVSGPVVLKAVPNETDKFYQEIEFILRVKRQFTLREEDEGRKELGHLEPVVDALGGWTDFQMLSDDQASRNRISKALTEVHSEVG